MEKVRMMGQKGVIPAPNLPKKMWDGVPQRGPTLMGGSNTLCPAAAIWGFQGGLGGKKIKSNREELKKKNHSGTRNWDNEEGITSGLPK